MTTISSARWFKLPSITPRHDHGITHAHDNPERAIVVYGGMESFGEEGVWDAWRLLPGQQEWTAIPWGGESVPPRGGFAAADLDNSKLLMIGGYSTYEGTLGSHHMRSMACDELSEWKLCSAETGHEGNAVRSGHSVTKVGPNGSVLLFGGFGETEALNDLYQVVVPSNTSEPRVHWRTLTPSQSTPRPSPRSAHAAVDIGANRMVVFGGYGEAGAMNDLWELNLGGSVEEPVVPSSDSLVQQDQCTWTQIASTGAVPEERSGHSLIRIDERYVVLFGGVGDDGAAMSDLHVYDSEEKSWEMLETSGCVPEGRYNHRAVHTQWQDRSTMIVTGGTIPGGDGDMGMGEVTGECFGLDLGPWVE